MAGKRLGVGVIGAGLWSNWAHLPGWRRDERCEIVAVCDQELDRAKTAANEVGASAATADYHDLLDRDDIDIIDVVTRTPSISRSTWPPSRQAGTCSARSPSRTTSRTCGGSLTVRRRK